MAKDGDAQAITLSFEGPMAVLRLNRPKRLNALTAGMLGLFEQHLAAVAARDDIACVVLTGAGRAFSAGVDLEKAAEMFGQGGSAKTPDSIIRAFSKPVVAAVNGPCFTGGWELALACDLVIASDRALFADTHAKFGIAPSWGLSVKLARACGVHTAMDLHLTSRRIDGAEAVRLGLASRVVPHDRLMDECREIAKTMAGQFQPMMAYMKELVRDGHAMPLGDARKREIERALRYYTQMTPQQFKAMRAFLAKRKGGGSRSKL